MRRYRLFLSCIFVLAVILAAWTFRPRTLLDRATLVTGPRYWWMHWFWLSEHEILTFRKSGPRLRAIRFDTRTGSESELSGLNRALDGLTPGGEMHLSPDRKSILWNAIERNRVTSHVAAVTKLDGDTQVDRRPADNMSWRADGSGWVRLFRNPRDRIAQIQLHEIGSPRMARVRIPDLWDIVVREAGTKFIYLPTLLGPIDKSRFLVRSSGPRVSTHLTEVDLHNPDQTKSWSVENPNPYNIADIKISPDGVSLLWVAWANPPKSDFRIWIERLMPFMRTPNPSGFDLRISRIDGSKSRSLGFLPFWNGMTDNEAQQVGSTVQWEPDSRSIGFVYRNCLYTIATE